MVIIKQESAARKTLVEFNKAMRNRILKILAEPLTNADQVYKDMILEGIESSPGTPKPIFIYVNRQTKEFSIVDYGKSMNREELIDRFELRGQEQITHHKKSRSIFGQGLSDLMFSRNHGGMINCIKNGYFYQAEFKHRRVKTDTGKEKIDNLIIIEDRKIKADELIRSRNYIPNGNGTCIQFKFEEGNFPRNDTLIKGLMSMYMLRYINADEQRNISLIIFDSKGKISDPIKIKYKFRNVDETNRPVIIEDFLKYEMWNLPIKGWVASWSEPLTQGEVEKDEREGGLLIVDENKNVYDLTLFDFDFHDSARKLYGELEITGIRDLINEKLNDLRSPEEILTNTRDGFDKNHSFYKNYLSPLITKWLKPIIQEEEKNHTSHKTSLSKETQDRHKKAFSLLNDLDKKLNKEIIDLGDDEDSNGPDQDKLKVKRPLNGIEFSRKKITIVVDKNYKIKLKVDTKIIPLGSEIKIENHETTIIVNPNKIIVNKEETSEEEIFLTSLILHGSTKNKTDTIVASINEKKTEVLVEVIDEEIYKPSKGIEFYPKSYGKPVGSHGKLCLYIDTSKFDNIVGKIIFKIDQKAIVLDKQEIEISDNYKAYNGILKIENGFRGHQDATTGNVIAEFKDCIDSAEIKISGIEGTGGGAFKEWLYVNMEAQPFQSFYNEITGTIQINAKFPHLQMYFGNDQVSAEEAIKNNLHAQTMLAEIILDEALTKIVTSAYMNGALYRRYPNDPTTDIRRYIHEKKLDIARDFHKFFIDFNLKNKKDEKNIK